MGYPHRRRNRVPAFEPMESRMLLSGASVWTNQVDYLPGNTAVINASGFLAGETVQFQVLHTDGTSNTGTNEVPWQVYRHERHRQPADELASRPFGHWLLRGHCDRRDFWGGGDELSDSAAYASPIVPPAASIATNLSTTRPAARPRLTPLVSAPVRPFN